ncbi:MAG TPA: uracil-DNA glycosylase [Alcaligenes sp.]|nr:uracil-DNA glycosylase [Alcaligenes sp.]HRL26957.1 uracil-DNA glycosylase [Alcaligenes sp.]
MSAFEPLSLLQRTWLLELGLERSFLVRLPQAQEPSARPTLPEQGVPVMDSVPARAAQAVSSLSASDSPPVEQSSAMTARDQALALLRKPGRQTVSAAEPVQNTRPAVLIQPEQAVDMSSLQEQVQACQECGLYTGRALTVFGAGVTPEPDWMVIGEAPGASDDRSGQPFDGKAGQLLQAMLASVIPQASVYMSHLVKCRPLGNRPPTLEEMAACRAFLDAQIRLVQPRRLLAVGNLAAAALSGRSDDLEVLRGQTLSYTDALGRELPLLVTYHPASLLLRPQHKANAWRDLVLLGRLQAQG